MLKSRPLLKTSLAILCIGFALLLIPIRAAEPLPSKLNDDAFWKMITDFSEEGGYFRFENFLSNELGFRPTGRSSFHTFWRESARRAWMRNQRRKSFSLLTTV